MRTSHNFDLTVGAGYGRLLALMFGRCPGKRFFVGWQTGGSAVRSTLWHTRWQTRSFAAKIVANHGIEKMRWLHGRRRVTVTAWNESITANLALTQPL